MGTVFVRASRRAKAYVRTTSLVKGAYVSNNPSAAQFRLDKIRSKVFERSFSKKLSSRRRKQLHALGVKVHTMRNNLYKG